MVTGTVAQTIYTRALSQAAEAEGSLQALAHVLRVPEPTLQRWIAGSAQMPLQAFLRLLELLAEYEKRGGATGAAASANAEPLTFRIGALLARCARCDGTEFLAADPAQPLRFTADVLCRTCGERIMHSALVAQLAKDAVHHSRATRIARTKRRAVPTRAGAASPPTLESAVKSDKGKDQP